MNIRRFFDRVQLNLHLLGFHRLASFVGRFGTPSLPPAEVDEHDRPTLPYPTVPSIDVEVYDDDAPTQKIKVLNFDPTFNNNEGIDVDKDVVFPRSHLDVN